MVYLQIVENNLMSHIFWETHAFIMVLLTAPVTLSHTTSIRLLTYTMKTNDFLLTYVCAGIFLSSVHGEWSIANYLDVVKNVASSTP